MCIIFVEKQEDGLAAGSPFSPFDFCQSPIDNILNLVDSPLSQARPTKLFRTEDSPGMSSTPSANVPPGNQPTALFHAGKQVHQSFFFTTVRIFFISTLSTNGGTKCNAIWDKYECQQQIHVPEIPTAKFWCL